MASRNGLNPKIRGPKGVGFGRALPSAFGFGNGFKPDGVNDYFTIPRMVGKYINHPLCMELWTKPTSNVTCSWLSIKWTSENALYLNFDKRGLGTTGDGTQQAFINNPDGSLHHLIGYVDFVNLEMGQITDANPIGYIKASINPVKGYMYINSPIANFVIACSSNGEEFSPHLMDELRVYKVLLPYSEVSDNYYSGRGANPSRTENLLCWYKFESFEMLDFSADQDGSNIHLGVRDLSGNNNHALPHNIVTNPGAPDYVIVPFQ